MKILIAAHHYPVASGRYMADAFRRLGHEVKTAGDAHGNEIWGMTVDAKYEWKPDSDIPGADASWPDLVLVMDSDPWIWAQVQLHWADTKTPIAVYGVDNHVRSYEHELFNHYFLAHYHGAAYPVNPMRKDHTWLPCAADSKLFTPSPIAWHEREYDVCMVGVAYPERQMIAALMEHAGLKVFKATGLLFEEYRDAYWNSRISLCKSAAGDVAQRIFETGRMSCAIISDPLRDLEDPVVNAALKLRGMAFYTSPQLAVEIAKEMIAGDVAYELTRMSTEKTAPIDSAKNIQSVGTASATSMAKSCHPHTWEARAQVIVNWFEREYGKAESVEVKSKEILLPFMPSIPDEEKQEYIDAAKALVNGTTAAEATQLLAHVSTALSKPIEPMPKLYPATEIYPEWTPERKPFLNLGCGRVLLPGERPAHHALIPENIYQDEQWVNIDRVGTVGANQVFDLFTYPWPLESNSYDGALLTHLCEHIPHEINVDLAEKSFYVDTRTGKEVKLQDQYLMGDDQQYLRLAHGTNPRAEELSKLQDGWYAFFSELYRVLTPGAEVHILSPHARSDGAISDPTHTRYLLPESFNHSMQPNPDAPFEYVTGGIHFETVATLYGVTQEYMHLTPQPIDPPHVQQAKHAQLEHIARTQNNVIPEFYVRLKVVK